MNFPSADGRVFLVGAMRAGTTSLYNYLAQHPDIFPSSQKEPRFFCHPSQPVSEQRAYESLFAGRTRERWTFEASTHYARFPKYQGVAQRIRETFPEARIIYIVRSPVDRIASAYLHWRAHGRERRGFDEAVFSEPSEYLDVSRYHMQLAQYRQVFPPERILILVFESFITDTRATVRRVCEFLDIDPAFEPANAGQRFNESTRESEAGAVLAFLRRSGLHDRIPWRARRWAEGRLRRPVPARASLVSVGARTRIMEHLEEDLLQLKALLGDSISHWNLPYE